MEVGEYIRTKEGLIGKVLIFYGKDECYKKMNNYSIDSIDGAVYEEDIKSHSKYIIALVEVGDYINGERVTYKGKTKTGRTQIITEDSTDFFLKYEYIETILTHEQYEQNCYKIGE